MVESRELQAILIQWGTTYPKVLNSSSKIRGKINSNIKRAAYRGIPDYNPGTSIIEAQSGYTTPLNMKGILSLRFQDYYYPEKAAHGVTGVSSITLNLYNGEVYHFYNLFRPESDYQNRINQIIQAQIASAQIPMLKPFAGIGPNEDYYLTPNSLVIYYQPYVYTPGYFGILEFTISYQQIIDIINPNGPISRILTP